MKPQLEKKKITLKYLPQFSFLLHALLIAGSRTNFTFVITFPILHSESSLVSAP
jgi:hypothetical protein